MREGLSYPPKIYVKGSDWYLKVIRDENVNEEEVEVIKYAEGIVKNGNVKFRPTKEFIESLFNRDFIDNFPSFTDTKIYLAYGSNKYDICSYCDGEVFGEVYADMFNNIKASDMKNVAWKHLDKLIEGASNIGFGALGVTVSNYIIKEMKRNKEIRQKIKSMIEDISKEEVKKIREVVSQCKENEMNTYLCMIEYNDDYNSEYYSTLNLGESFIYKLNSRIFKDEYIRENLCNGIKGHAFAYNEQDYETLKEYCGW